MAARYIVPVDPASGRGEAVVIQVQQEGTHPLDVRLVGCEGESPYVTTIKHRNLAKLKHKFKGSDAEWAIVLSHFLLQQQPEKGDAGLLEGVRMVYTLKNNKLELSFRQDVQNFKITLGEIVLPQDDEFEFNPFDWAQASATAHSKTLQRLAALEAKVNNERDTIAKLNAQLDDFIKAKNESEATMLQQFMALLNEKKRKIRDQNRLLDCTNVNPGTATAVKSTKADTKTRKPKTSRTAKRKAPAQAAEPDSAPDLDGDQMEIDQAKVEEQSDIEIPGPVTPDRSDDETDEESDSAPQPRAKSSETLRSNSEATQGSKREATNSRGVPPPRSLPFSKRVTRGKSAEKEPAPSIEDDKDEETDDEEL